MTENVNQEFDLAFSYLNETGRNIYLTGKAGTGKTTFLRRFKQETTKKLLVAAPTGVAAINAGGVTLSSLFQLPQTLFFPDEDLSAPPDGGMTLTQLISKYAIPKEKSILLNELELLVIDEVSMLRADILDAIDHILRHIRRDARPFGGVQVALIGDLFQLPPVIKPSEWEILSKYYNSRFFFDAKVIPQSKLLFIELSYVFRQQDNDFIRLLNNIRLNQTTSQDMALLNSYYRQEIKTIDGDIYLTSLNATANEINKSRLEELPGELHLLEAEVTGGTEEKDVPVLKTIRLKIGAKVMLVSNDKTPNKRYFNGKIGTVSEIDPNELTINFSGEAPLKLQRELWQQIDYRAGRNARQVEEAVLGEFRQFPIRLAWAVTIHKSQGLTFDQAIIDAGRSFEAGQIYVALSRIRSIAGLTLASKITQGIISCNPRVVEYSRSPVPYYLLAEQFQGERNSYIQDFLLNAFNFNKLVNSVRLISGGIEKWQKTSYSVVNTILEQLISDLSEQDENTIRFRQQLIQYTQGNTAADKTKLSDRIKAAADYYDNLFKAKFITVVAEQIHKLAEKAPQDLTASLKTVADLLESKLNEQLKAVNIARGISDSLPSEQLLALITPPFEKPSHAQPATKSRNSPKGKPGINKSLQTTFQLYIEGNTILEIATSRNISVATVHGHLSELVLLGMIEAEKLVNATRLKEISDCIASKGEDVNIIKIEMGPDYSFFEVRTAISHYQLQHGKSANAIKSS